MNEFEMFDLYRKNHTKIQGRREGEGYCDVDYLLRVWKENKSKMLAPLFGDKLILEKNISYNRPQEDMSREMGSVLRATYEFFNDVMQALCPIMGTTGDWDDRNEDCCIVWQSLRSQLFNPDSLVENNLILGRHYINDVRDDIKSFMLTFPNGHKVQLQRGMKITRAFTQICKELGKSDEWEKFRIAHSQVLNQKRLTGTLCLSIHPLDYATASDNDNGWSSCMSWQDEGCYRMGTVEMMNSPMVICAYLKSNKQYMELDGGQWNSKKWRAWILVDKDVIVCNRHYPYHQEEMAINCLQWVCDLLKEHYGWEYGDIHKDFYSWMRRNNHEIEYYTGYMYNDLGGDDVIGCVRAGAKSIHKSIGFSGPAECMVCGEIIPEDVQDAGRLECERCYEEPRCHDCGDIISGEIFYDDEGNAYCESCFNERFATCNYCDETVSSDEIMGVQFPIYTDLIKEAIDKLEPYKEKNHRPAYVFVDRHDYVYRRWCVHREIHHLDEQYLCEKCQRRFGVGEAYIGKNNDYYMITINPDKVSMDTAYDMFYATEYKWARDVVQDPDYNEQDKAVAQIIYDFWKVNWDRFVAEYHADQERD